MPGIVGMAAALKESTDHMAENMKKITTLREKLITGLEKIPHSKLNGDRNLRVPGTVNFCFEGIEGESMLLLLDANGIAASSGSASRSSPGSCTAQTGTVRSASVSRRNTVLLTASPPPAPPRRAAAAR